MNIAFIPARCGSESIPFKNIKIICGKPLIYWSLLALTKSKTIDQIYVATDCDEIKDTVIDFNFDNVQIFDRSNTNAINTASTESVMLEFLENKKCSVYTARPMQCRTWPFWKENMNIKKWNEELINFCPGIGKGKLISASMIQKKINRELKNDKQIIKDDKP